MWLNKLVSWGPCGLPITNRRLGENKFTTNEWVSVQPNHLQQGTELTTFSAQSWKVMWYHMKHEHHLVLFHLWLHLPFVLARGSQGTGGGPPANHELPNQKFANRHQLFMYYDLAQQWRLPICANLWIPSTAASLLLKPEILCCPNKMVLAQNFGTVC